MLWEAFCRTDRFPEWWPWLRVPPTARLVEGTTTPCVVRSPLLYSLRFDVSVLKVVPERLVTTRVSGDLDGTARLEVAPHPEGSEARLAWEVDVVAPPLRAASRVARPVMEWGHDWVVEMGLRQFRRALGAGAG